jgi:hypothetical protein
MPAAAPTTECERLKKLQIPANNESICWWLSVNLALFHKKRPEIDSDLDSIRGQAQELIAKVYNHYNGTTDIQSMQELQDEIRNNLAKDTNTPFNIDSKGQEAASEYIMYLQKILPTLEKTYIQLINGYPSAFQQMYDVYYHSLYFGLPRDSTDVNTPDASLDALYEFPDVIIPSTRNTIVLSFERNGIDKYSTYPITPLKVIKLPTAKENLKKDTVYPEWVKACINNTETSTFYLDAMTVSSPGGGHFVTYVKCEDSDVWLYDDGLTAGELGVKGGAEVFETFDDMMSKHSSIRENVVLLYYSKQSL